MTPQFSASSLCGRVRFVAAPFGYGPRIAAETLAASLGIKLSTWRNSNVIAEKGSKKDVVIINVGNEGYEVRPSETIFRVWVDCLMWLRTGLPQSVKEYDLFLAEAFFSIRSELAGVPGIEAIS